MKINPFVIFILSAVPQVALSQGSGPELPDNRFVFRFGGQIFSSFTTELRVDAPALPGDGVNLENETSLDEDISVLRLDGSVRFGRRHYLTLSWFKYERTGFKRLETDIDWEGEIYPIGADVESLFGQEVIKLGYSYAFLKRPRASMALSGGLHVSEFDIGLRIVGDSQLFEAQGSRINVTAPLPVLGLSGAYQVSEKWRFFGRVDWLDIQVGDYQGIYTDLTASMEYQAFERIAFGFGINSTLLDVQAEEDALRGQIDIGFDAITVYMTGGFGS